jgi:Rho termination factor, N-terminal domain
MTAATDRTKERADRAQRSIRSLLADSAYATIGAGGAAIEFVRSIDRTRAGQARNLGKDAPKQLRQLREQGVASARSAIDGSVTGVRTLREQATKEFDDLAKRGRGLVGSVRDSAAVRQAVGQTRTARSRVKAAGTSVGRAAEDTAKAVDRAGTIVADRTEPGTGQHTAGRTGTSTATAGRRGGAVRPYEERTVEELRDRARELGIEGFSTMTKDELIAALRKQR